MYVGHQASYCSIKPPGVFLPPLDKPPTQAFLVWSRNTPPHQHLLNLGQHFLPPPPPLPITIYIEGKANLDG